MPFEFTFYTVYVLTKEGKPKTESVIRADGLMSRYVFFNRRTVKMLIGAKEKVENLNVEALIFSDSGTACIGREASRLV